MWDWSHGLVVNLGVLGLEVWGSILRQGPILLVSGHAVAAFHIQNRGRLVMDLSSGQIFLRKKKKKSYVDVTGFIFLRRNAFNSIHTIVFFLISMYHILTKKFNYR